MSRKQLQDALQAQMASAPVEERAKIEAQMASVEKAAASSSAAAAPNSRSPRRSRDANVDYESEARHAQREADDLARRLAELEERMLRERAEEAARAQALLEKALAGQLSNEEAQQEKAKAKQHEATASESKKRSNGGGGSVVSAASSTGRRSADGRRGSSDLAADESGPGVSRRGGIDMGFRGNGGGGYGSSGRGVEIGVQVGGGSGSGPSRGTPTVGDTMDDSPNAMRPEGGGGRSKLPARCVTSLCEIDFTRKGVKEMNRLMCRRLVSALYQVKVEMNKADDKEGRRRQSFPEFIPDQFIVLYGMKQLAIKNINEFLYGVRRCRYRNRAGSEKEE